MIYNDVFCRMLTSYVLYETSTQWNVGPRLAHSVGFFFPVRVLKPNPVHKLGPGLPKTKGCETVAHFGVNGQNLPETPSPDPTEERESKEDVLLVGILADKDCGASRSDPDVEDML